MNYMKQVAEMLGVELGEEFTIEEYDDCKFKFTEDGDCKFKFTEDGVMEISPKHKEWYDSDELEYLLNGIHTIVKLPWKPKKGYPYKCLTINGDIISEVWNGISIDYYRFNAHNCFKTVEEITNEVIRRVLKEMKGEYENDL